MKVSLVSSVKSAMRASAILLIFIVLYQLILVMGLVCPDPEREEAKPCKKHCEYYCNRDKPVCYRCKEGRTEGCYCKGNFLRHPVSHRCVGAYKCFSADSKERGASFEESIESIDNNSDGDFELF